MQKFAVLEAKSHTLVSAEYESEAEERVRWLFIEMRKLALLRCGPAPETSPIKLQFYQLKIPNLID